MSFTENDRKVQSKSGKSFPRGEAHTCARFEQAIALALKTEFGGGPSAIKTAARVTRANQRAVRNWFEAKNGPSLQYLVPLLRHSDVVLRTVLELAGRRDLMVASDFAKLRKKLVDLVTVIDNNRR